MCVILIKCWFKGVLKVGGESKEGVPSPPPNQNDIPDLSGSEYMIGGVSPGFKSISGLPKSFLGCMSNIQIAQQGYNPMSGISWGVQPTCSDKVRTSYRWCKMICNIKIFLESELKFSL